MIIKIKVARISGYNISQKKRKYFILDYWKNFTPIFQNWDK